MTACCNQSKNSVNVTPTRITNSAVEVSIHHTEGEHYLCLSICNKTNRGIYVPEVEILKMGLSVYIQKRCKTVDVTDEFNTLILDNAYSIDRSKANKSCGHVFFKGKLDYEVCNSLAPEIFAINKKLDKKRLFVTVLDKLSNAIFLEPKGCYNEVVPIPDYFINKKLIVNYRYPYRYPPILTGK